MRQQLNILKTQYWSWFIVWRIHTCIVHPKFHASRVYSLTEFLPLSEDHCTNFEHFYIDPVWEVVELQQKIVRVISQIFCDLAVAYFASLWLTSQEIKCLAVVQCCLDFILINTKAKYVVEISCGSGEWCYYHCGCLLRLKYLCRQRSFWNLSFFFFFCWTLRAIFLKSRIVLISISNFRIN